MSVFQCQCSAEAAVSPTKLPSELQICERRLQLLPRYSHGGCRCVGLAVSPKQQLLATGGNDGSVTVWDTSSRTMLNCIYQADAHCNTVALSHDGSLLAYSGATEGPVYTSAEAAAAAESTMRREVPRRLAALDIAESFADASSSPVIHKCGLSLREQRVCSFRIVPTPDGHAGVATSQVVTLVDNMVVQARPYKRMAQCQPLSFCGWHC